VSLVFDVGVLLTAFFAGLLGSGHCFGMCGGIAAGLGTIPAPGESQNTVKTRTATAVLFNVGRIFSYAALGLISAWILSSAGQMLNVPLWSKILRLLTALMIFMIGLQFLFNWQLLGVIERAGARVWRLVLPLAVRASALPGGAGRLLLGLCWGLLPCGLVYTVLLTAAAAGEPIGGSLIMMAFGIGTLPSMLGMSLAAPALAAFLTDQWTRRLLGAAMILLAVLSVSLMAINMQGKGHNHSAVPGIAPVSVAVMTVSR
jgi:sulfite exporter TauE/SafE